MIKRKVGRPRKESSQRLNISNSRVEFIRILINLSNDTFNKLKKVILEALK